MGKKIKSITKICVDSSQEESLFFPGCKDTKVFNFSPTSWLKSSWNGVILMESSGRAQCRPLLLTDWTFYSGSSFISFIEYLPCFGASALTSILARMATVHYSTCLYRNSWKQGLVLLSWPRYSMYWFV